MNTTDFSYLDLNDVDEDMVVTAHIGLGNLPHRACEHILKKTEESMRPIIDRVVDKGGIFYLIPSHETGFVSGISFSKSRVNPSISEAMEEDIAYFKERMDILLSEDAEVTTAEKAMISSLSEEQEQSTTLASAVEQLMLDDDMAGAILKMFNELEEDQAEEDNSYNRAMKVVD